MNLEDPVILKPWIEQTSADDFVEERESEDAETRTLIARTAQLLSAVNQTKHANDNLRRPPLCCSASAWHMSLSKQHVCAEDGNSTLGSDDEEYGEGDECIKTESVDMVLQSMTRAGNYLAGDVHPSWPTIEQTSVEERANGMGSANGYESEGSEDIGKDTAWKCGKLEQEQGDDTLNRATNTSKARTIINAMLTNLIRLGFREDITRTALEEGALEIDHYDSDCDLAYEDIFMSLVKMVCDAHVDMSGGDDVEQSWKLQERNSGSHVQKDIVDAKSPSSLNQLSFLPFEWPVFDMAQFEFESARPGTCFNSVCVLTNLPLVSMDRTEELVNVLSCNLFCMIGDPIQVVIPSTSSTGRTKGHAFLEFDGPDVAQKCALAVDGLTWGKGSLGRIRGNLFRQYQKKSPAAEDSISDNRASIPSSLVSVPGSGSLLDAAAVPFLTSGHHDNLTVERFRPDLGIAQQQPFICDSDEDDSDSGEWVCRRPLDHEQFSPSPLSHLSSGSAGSSVQYEPTQYDIAMQFGWDDKASDDEYSVQQKRKVEDGNENDTSFDCNSVLGFQGSDEEELMGHSFCKELVREYPPTRVTLSLGEVTATRSTVISTAPAVALESHADCDMAMPSWDVDENNDIDNKPWRHYCEDLNMAQFEFESARPGTCFNSVCVLTNLPLVSMDRTEKLVKVLSCNLFCMIGDPIQVVIPSTSSTGRTKGHAFLEFDGPDVAQKCALAVDGLTWGKGSLGRIRGNLFRQYQTKSPAAEDSISDNRASIPSSLVSVPGYGSLLDAAAVPFPTSGHHDNLTVERFRPDLGIAQQQPFICDSDEDDSDSGEWVCRRPLDHEQFSPSPLSHLSSGSAGSSVQYEPTQYDIAMQFGWGNEASDDEYSVQQKRKLKDDNENDTSFDCNSVLGFQGSDEEELMGHSFCKELVREYSPTRVTLSLGEVTATRSTVISTAPAVALESHADCDMAMPSWDVDENNDIDNKPWRHYCEDLIFRNCEMQEQISFARRRIVQLSHNNQKLHLLIDRVERDRDRLLLENNVLQTQLHEHEDHEQHHDSLMKELIVLRKRVTQQEHSFDGRTPDPLQQLKAACNVRSRFSYGIRAALSEIASVSLTNCKMEELKEWEQQLESTLSHVRSIKEEKALQVQKKLDRQVEEQNELKLCVICLSNEKSILCLPCRHLCLCKTCAYRQEVTKCPICRLEIEEMLAVYS
ncbi:hypothetical protein DD238_001270 [Peronospora effusa]|uniref:RING-type domain-containing protein n=1 Tax=Peronospora effusa TaxID=542832 RepID=A0A3M6VL52_9STRA|nr:hypothetical protein DD238_001270 [Peronospora effusa]